MGQSSNDFPLQEKGLAFNGNWKKNNIQHLPLVKSNILLPLLYIKLGLMTDFVKLMDQTGLPFR
jgi:hypothetical protein